jgi:uncharacterized protein (TIGR03083 family)
MAGTTSPTPDRPEGGAAGLKRSPAVDVAGLTRPPLLAPPEFLARFDTAAAEFAQLVADGDLDAPVPPCPEWTFTDLIAHLGEVHQWARHAVIAGNPNAEPVPAPSGRPALVEWYREAAGALSGTLKQTDPAAPAWTFGPEPRTASFWFRRQVHEITVHLWDAKVSQGLTATIDDIVARDGIDELTGMFFPRQVRLGRTPPLAQALALETDQDRWVLAGNGTGPTGPGDARADATIAGPSEALLLLLWGRTGPDDPRLTVTGDENAAHAVLNHALTP